MAPLRRYVWVGVLIGLAVAAVAMTAYCVVLALPLTTNQYPQTRDESSERFGDVLLFGVVYLTLMWVPTAAAFGGALGVITYFTRTRYLLRGRNAI